VPRRLGFPTGLSFVPAKSGSQCVSALRYRHHRRWRTAADIQRRRSGAAVWAAAGRLRGSLHFRRAAGSQYGTQECIFGVAKPPPTPNWMCS